MLNAPVTLGSSFGLFNSSHSSHLRSPLISSKIPMVPTSHLSNLSIFWDVVTPDQTTIAYSLFFMPATPTFLWLCEYLHFRVHHVFYACHWTYLISVHHVQRGWKEKFLWSIQSILYSSFSKIRFLCHNFWLLLKICNDVIVGHTYLKSYCTLDCFFHSVFPKLEVLKICWISVFFLALAWISRW